MVKDITELMKPRLIHGDCQDACLGILSESVDLILADLPYGTTQCSWDEIIPFDKMWHEVIRVAKRKAPIVFHAQQPFASALIMSNIGMFKYELIWEKSKATGFLNSKKRPLVAHENMLVFCNGTPNYYPQMKEGKPYDKGVRKEQTVDDIYGQFDQKHIKSNGSRYPRSVQYFKTAESEGKTFHKSQKPVELSKWVVNTYSKQGDTVLDICMGSGTTGIACINTDRNFIGIEKEEKYFQIAKDRIETEYSQYINTKGQ